MLIIAAGSALGGIARYSMQTFVYRLYPERFPLGTFVVNLTGCFLIGLFFSLAEKTGAIGPAMKLLLITGFCGGYTTFSTFSVDSLSLLRRGDVLNFILYAAGSLIAGMLMTYLGMRIVRTA